MKRSRRSAAFVALTAAAVVVSSPGAWAADVDGTLVNAVEVNQWTPPSSDPSGIAVDSDGNLTISDGEVEETTFYRGANIFHASRTGSLLSTSDTTTFSDEPTGIAYGPNGLIFISDDDADAVFVATSFDDPSPVRISTSRFMADPEGVAYDTYRKELLIANGESAGFVRYSPGPDQRFGTTDDVAGQLIAVPGAVDNEGIAYDSARDTVLLLDSGSQEKIFEMTHNGSIINTVDLAGISGMQAPAGVDVATATSGGGRNYFVVDRGRDPGTNSSVNDGKLFEVRVTGLSDAGPGVNQPPTANAGVDKVLEVTEQVTLTGSGNDPEGGPLTYAWTRTSGPGAVTFGSAAAATTTASFAAAGQYVLRLTVTDDQGSSGFDEVAVTVTEAGGNASIVVPITMSSDDAREGDAGSPTYVSTGATTNDLGTGVHESGTYLGQSYPTKIGLRFPNLQIPQGAEILSAKIQFMATSLPADGSLPSSGAAAFEIVGEDTDNAATYSNAGNGKVSSRAYNTTSVAWAPADWTVAYQQGPAQLTPELKTILQEIVDGPGWAAGNAAAFKIEGTGRRIARSVDGVTASRPNAAPRLLLEFTTQPSGPRNQAPMVDAGADAAVKMPASATLDGTVTDDGLPAGGTLSTSWSKVSGPGAVTFTDAAAVDTTATFDTAGTYVLRLTANDGGAPAVNDDVTITVLPADASNVAPMVDAGADATVKMPASATLDGTVTDDGLPAGGALATSWSKVSGPGVVTFADAAAVDTTATFDTAGTYVLRLTGNDGALQASDDVTVVVKGASTGGGGGGSTPPPTTTPPPTSPPTTPTPPPAEVETEVTLQAGHGAIRHGMTVRLDGVVTRDDKGAAGAAVELYVSRDGGDFELLDAGTSAGDGSFSFEDRPAVSSEYVARSGGASSPTVEVMVRPRLGAKLRHSMVKAGTKTAIVGFVSPAAEGQLLRLEERFGTTWRTVRTVKVAGGELSRFRFMVRPEGSRAHWYRVVSPAQAGRALAVVGGKQLRLQAYNATVKRVNHRADLVVVRNTGRVAFSLEGWMLLERRSGQKVGLPDFTVRPGRVVRIHSGEGADNRRNLHLGTGEMWAPRGVAVLRDARLRLADRLRF